MSYKIPKVAWTTRDVRFLTENFGVMKSTEIAKKLVRTPNAIRTYASKLNLKSKLPYNYCSENSKEIRELIDFGYHATEIAKMMGKTTKHIYNTCRDRSDLGGKWYRKLKQNTQLQRENSGIQTPIR